MRDVLRRSGLLQKLGPENIFPTVGESIDAYVARAQADSSGATSTGNAWTSHRAQAGATPNDPPAPRC